MIAPDLEIVVAPPAMPQASELLEAYFADVVGRYHGRPATRAELGRAMAEEPSDDLQPPGGLLWVALDGGIPAGCVGLRLVTVSVGEVTRMYVDPGHRRRGIGAALLDELEATASEWGLDRVQLDTRADLSEAQQLYLARGYIDVPPFSHGPYAQRWMAKPL